MFILIKRVVISRTYGRVKKRKIILKFLVGKNYVQRQRTRCRQCNNEKGLLGLQNGFQRQEWNPADSLSVGIRDPGVNSTNSYRKYQCFRHKDQRMFYLLDRWVKVFPNSGSEILLFEMSRWFLRQTCLSAWLAPKALSLESKQQRLEADY